MSDILTVTCTLTSGQVVTFDVTDTTSDDQEAARPGDYYRSLFGGPGVTNVTAPAATVSTAIIIPQAVGAGT